MVPRNEHGLRKADRHSNLHPLSSFKSGDLEGGAMIYLSEAGSQDPASKWTLTEG